PAGWLLPPVPGADGSSCVPAAGDYSPGAADDGWAACVSDDGQYHRFDPNISTRARVAAFETIAGLLLAGDAPSAKAFEDARVAYAQDQGLESRVSRREDEHYPKAAGACADMTEEEVAANADRCVGPARIRPLLNRAFADGQLGRDPLVNAARVEAGLLWFLYVSAHKEATSCATAKKDCDSSYAYYTGGEGPDGDLGLSHYIRALSAVVHDRVWDGILAVRCWRDLDGADAAADADMQRKAVAQLDRALLRGMALIVLSRVEALRDATCDTTRAAAYWTSVRILGNVLVREAKVRDAAKGAALEAALAIETPADADLDAVRSAVEAVFPCP
ncbi:MAG: hypothetical protein FJ087_21900, partial [Deltaproteobacteria bacterium]|nr:hypothetical protein [Deltaproteobacteria bacterium]